MHSNVPRVGNAAHASAESVTGSAAARRFAFVVRLRPEKHDEYLRLHADVWPGVRERMSSHNLRNYSIFLHGDLLFSYFEYTGVDFDRDMDEVGAHPESQEWGRITEACQTPLEGGSRTRGLWAQAAEVFHLV